MKRVLALVVSLCAVLALAVTSGGCEAIVSDTIPGFTCSGSGLSGCPAGQYCKGVGCTACEATDVCDGYDNDCNGKIDDGPLSDHDGDGYTVCGHTDPSGKLVDVDCNDNDPAVHPGATEVCNGIDDDCNGVVDDPNVVCPGQVCAPQLKQCVSTTQCNADNCKAPKQCDPNTQQCADPTANFDVGHECASDTECKSTICGFPALLNGSVSNAVCTSLCCTSNDCPTGFVCDATGSGGRYCVDATVVAGRTTPGTGAGGASCSNGTGCRSGICTGSVCTDTCCSDADCQNGTTCSKQTVNGHEGFWCANAGNSNPNSSCSGNGSCKSNLCDDISDRPRCITPCCTSANGACGQIYGFVPTACAEVATNDGGDHSAICAASSGKGGGPLGAACAVNDDCFSAQCDATSSHRCTDVCCVDANCPGGKCKPDAVGSLRCVF